MRRLTTFLFGMVAGALLLYGALSYHLIRSSDGLHLVPKIDARLACTYVDVRDFGFAEWKQHPEVAMALLKADRGELMESAAGDMIDAGLERLLPEPANR